MRREYGDRRPSEDVLEYNLLHQLECRQLDLRWFPGSQQEVLEEGEQGSG